MSGSEEVLMTHAGYSLSGRRKCWNGGVQSLLREEPTTRISYTSFSGISIVYNIECITIFHKQYPQRYSCCFDPEIIRNPLFQRWKMAIRNDDAEIKKIKDANFTLFRDCLSAPLI